MKFPRNARIFRGQLDMAPFAAVFFLLAMFLLMGSLVYTPGVRVQLPLADELPGIDQPNVAVAIDAHGRYYFANQPIAENELQVRLRQAARNCAEPLTLIIQADKLASYDMLTSLTMLARNAGITNALLATLPRARAPASSSRP